MNRPMFPMNDPLMAVVSAAKNGGNPMQLICQMAGRDPQIRQFFNMVQGKNSAQLEQLARNMARERGTTIENIAQQLGIM